MRDLFTYKLSYLSSHIRLCKRQAAYSISVQASQQLTIIKSVNPERMPSINTLRYAKEKHTDAFIMRYVRFGLNQDITVRKGLQCRGLHQDRTVSDNIENVCVSSPNTTLLPSPSPSPSPSPNHTGSSSDALLLSKNEKTTELCNTLKFRENMSLGHEETYRYVSQYVTDAQDLLLFTYVNEKRQHLKKKYSFNEYSSSTHVRSYNFNTSIKKINLTSLYKILKSFFLSLNSLISKPNVDVYPDMLRIRLFYYVLPSIKKMIRMKILHSYIRLGGPADTLRKEKIKRRKFKIIMNKVKMILFIAKWKEENTFIRMARPLTLRKDLKLKPEQAYAYQSSSISLEDVNQFRRVHKDLFYTLEPLTEERMHTSLALNKNKGTGMGVGVTARTLLDSSKTRSTLLELKLRKEATLVSLNKKKFKYLLFILEKLLKKTIILEVVRLKYPYHESTILAKILGFSSKSKNFRILMRNLLYTTIVKNPTKMIRKQNFSIIPSYLSGLKVRLAGRLRTQKIVPRFTVQSFQIGSLGRGKTNFTSSSRVTLKNKRGAFSFTVSTSHIFET